MGHDLLPFVLGQPCRKVLVYHNITPPEFFQGRPTFERAAIEGLSQLHALRPALAATIAVSNYNAQELSRRGFDGVEVVPLLRDFHQLRSARFDPRPTHVDVAALRLLFVGRLCANKAQRDLVHFMTQYADAFSHPVHLTLVGHGEHDPSYAASLHEQVARAGLESRVHVVGHVGEDELAGLYRAADAYVSFSRHEGFGVPLLEAMALDTPVVAYASSAVGDTLGDAGIKLAGPSAAELAAVLQRVFNDAPFRREVIRGQRLRLEHFRRDVVSQQLFDVLGRRIEGFPRPAAKTCAEPGARRRYLIEGPCETSYSLAIVNRELGVALDRRENTQAVFLPAEGSGSYHLSPEGLRRHPALADRLKPETGRSQQVVSIRNMYPIRTAGMLGELRLAYLFWEESKLPGRTVALINRHLDGVIAPSRFCRRVFRNSGVRIPIGVCGVGLSRPPAPPSEGEGLSSRYTFLHVSSGLPRKGVEELLLAYVSAFQNSDDVELVIKTHRNAENVVDHLRRRIMSAAPDAPRVRVIYDDLDDAEMAGLYARSRAVVLPSRGEGFNMPAAEALAAGCVVIATRYSGHLDFLDDDNAELVEFRLEASASHLSTSGSLWARADVDDLARCMRRAFGQGTTAPRRRWAAEAAEMSWTDVARRVDDFVNALEEQVIERPGLKLAWVSTWGTRCGIAAYSEKLAGALDPSLIDLRVFAAYGEIEGADEPSTTRMWSEGVDDLTELFDVVIAQQFDAVVIQYNYVFFTVTTLAEIVTRLEAAGVSCFVVLHRTTDAHRQEGALSLLDVAGGLKAATRLIVHAAQDVERLRSFGLVDNVMLLPHGVALAPTRDRFAVRELIGIGAASPVVAAYGFLLPGKGVLELVCAFALLLSGRPDARLLLVTAAYPGEASELEARRVRELIDELGVGAHVFFINSFLDDGQAMLLLQSADVIVNAYQHTGESTSAAARFALASGRPVIVTPIEIFDDLRQVTFTAKATGPLELVEAMEQVLEDDDLRASLAARQESWLQEHAWSAVGEQLGGCLLGVVADRKDVRFGRRVAAAPAAQDLVGDLGASWLHELSPEALVQLCYQRYLGRDPDQTGKGEYLAALGSGRQDRGSVMGEIAASAEAQGAGPDAVVDCKDLLADAWSVEDPDFVSLIYRAMLSREPDLEGLNYYTSLLQDGGISRQAIIDAIAQSAEFAHFHTLD